MLQEVRKLENKLKLAPIHMDVFGDKLSERVSSIRYYLLGLIEMTKTNNNKEKEITHG